jgi:hypothetical protein
VKISFQAPQAKRMSASADFHCWLMLRSAFICLCIMQAFFLTGHSADAKSRNYMTASQLQSALSSKDAKVRLEALQYHDPKLWKDFVKLLVKDPDAEVRECLANYYLQDSIFDSNRVELIESFANDPDERVKAAIARSSIAPEQTILRLIAQRRWRINHAAAGNVQRGTQILEAVLAQVPPLAKGQEKHDNDELWGAIFSLKKNPLMTPEMLRTLYEKGIPYFSERNALSDNQNWPADLVIQFGLKDTEKDLAGPKEEKFWKQINNDKTNKDHVLLLGFMLEGPVAGLRTAGVASRFTPAKALDKYFRSGLAAQDTNLEFLARNVATSKEVRLEMVKKTPVSDAGRVFSRLLANPDVETEVVEVIARRAASNRKIDDMDVYERDANEILRKRNDKK